MASDERLGVGDERWRQQWQLGFVREEEGKGGEERVRGTTSPSVNILWRTKVGMRHRIP
jgi:hypothetical protein